MTKARTLADMISDGVIGTTELADDVITPVKLDETGNYTVAQLSVDGVAQIRGVTVKDSSGTTKGYVQGDGDGLLIASDGSNNITFDVNAVERARIDASGNLMIGGTNGNPIGNHVSQIIANGANGLGVHRDGGVPFKAGTDADRNVIEVYRQGSLVGGLGVFSTNNLYVGGSVSGHAGLQFGSSQINPMQPAGTASDNVVDLGAPTERFKDLYLSGGVFLGGTGSSNHLEDYEEGTYNVTMVPQYGTITMNSARDLAKYVKIGSLVYVSGQVRLSSVSGASGSHVTFSLPFANSSGSELSSHHWSPVSVYAFGYTNRDQGLWLYDSNSSARFLDSNYNYVPPSAFSGDEEIIFSFTYRTDA